MLGCSKHCSVPCQDQIRKGAPKGDGPFPIKKKKKSWKTKPVGRPPRLDATGAMPLISLAQIFEAFFEADLPELPEYSDYADSSQEASSIAHHTALEETF